MKSSLKALAQVIWPLIIGIILGLIVTIVFGLSAKGGGGLTLLLIYLMYFKLFNTDPE